MLSVNLSGKYYVQFALSYSTTASNLNTWEWIHILRRSKRRAQTLYGSTVIVGYEGLGIDIVITMIVLIWDIN